MLRELTPEFYKKYELLPHRTNNLQASHAALTGNRALAASLIAPKVKHENFGYNKLHLDVLQLDKLTEKYATQSITKKAISDVNTTPLHLASINPNIAVIQKLLD